ncbi:signal peptide peptidase SppA [Roseofilum sp. BLCC_M154]|uniref:Protease 4 n=1 Tax=Roseofilum acuticapitatum BLCC-M154 TaxID=3022444 RepID=A0ABT7AZU4_9CYAN|nr:signal peptide peptidase SppA [Roseofilum acuticapitatum]MDJ1172426.1 signal peptide peptidase SppA [Roseofilum acuticapitatum BLCC-M154]
MRQFLKYTFASILGTLIGVVLLGVVGMGGFIVLLASLAAKDTTPQVKDRSVLVLDLGLRINDTEPSSTTTTAINEALSGTNKRTITLRQFLDTVEGAIADERIVGLYLQGTDTDVGVGWGNLREIRAALKRFREAGKPIIAYDLSWSKKEYYLASVADRVIVHPMGNLELNGLSSEVMFLGGALQKYGVGVQVVRAGKYKSAVEPFTSTQLSAENRQQIQVLLDGIWGDFREQISGDRPVNAAQIQVLSNNSGILFANDAQQNGFVDEIWFEDQVIEDLKTLTESKEEAESFRKISFPTYASVPQEVDLAVDRISEQKVALLYAEGSIVDGEGRVGENEIGGDRYASILRDLRLDDRVKAIVVRINSPGGSATASEVIRRELELIRAANKPVIVSMGNYAASGGYWIATASDRILAEPNTITGSIGVFGILPNIQQIANQNGITWDVVKTGAYADLGSSARPRSPAELSLYQRNVNQIYQQFLQKVAQSRNLTVEQVNQIAQGRVWSGKDAKGINLIDELGGLQEAIAQAAEMAELGTDWQLEEYPQTRSLEERLIEQLIGIHHTPEASDWLMEEVQKFKAEVDELITLNDPLGMYTRMPFYLEIE